MTLQKAYVAFDQYTLVAFNGGLINVFIGHTPNERKLFNGHFPSVGLLHSWTYLINTPRTNID